MGSTRVCDVRGWGGSSRGQRLMKAQDSQPYLRAPQQHIKIFSNNNNINIFQYFDLPCCWLRHRSKVYMMRVLAANSCNQFLLKCRKVAIFEDLPNQRAGIGFSFCKLQVMLDIGVWILHLQTSLGASWIQNINHLWMSHIWICNIMLNLFCFVVANGQFAILPERNFFRKSFFFEPDGGATFSEQPPLTLRQNIFVGHPDSCIFRCHRVCWARITGENIWMAKYFSLNWCFTKR